MTESQNLSTTSLETKKKRADILYECLKGFYIRYRKPVPRDENMRREMYYALKKDFNSIPTDELEAMFDHAYRIHNRNLMPTNREILEYWRNNKRSVPITQASSGCKTCDDSGYVTAYVEKHDTRLDRKIKHNHSFRCSCSLGRSKPPTVPEWSIDLQNLGYKLWD